MNKEELKEHKNKMKEYFKENDKRDLWNPWQQSHFDWNERHNYVDPDDSGYDDNWREWN